MKDPRNIVKRVMITEKGSLLREQENAYIFEVHPSSNKIEIRQAVRAIFNVDVVDVRTMNVIGKVKRLGRTSGRRSAWKKAIVTLKPGQTIEQVDQI